MTKSKRVLETISWVVDDEVTDEQLGQHLSAIYAQAEEADDYPVEELTWRAVVGEEM